MQDILLQKLQLKEKGFEHFLGDPTRPFLFRKVQGEALLCIDIYFEGTLFSGASRWIVIPKVEDLLHPLVQKYRLGNYDNMTLLSWLKPKSQEYLESHQKAQKIRLSSERNINQVVSLIQTCIDLEFQPFWDRYSVLQNINDDIIDKVDQMKLSSYIPGETPWKKLIIMRLCNNKNYSSYVEWLESIWSKKSLTEDLSQNNNYQMYLELRGILENQNT
jgi:hypothetical protein